MKEKKSFVYDASGIEFAIYQTTKQTKSGLKHYWLLADHSSGKRRLLCHTSLKAAQRHADEIRRAMAKGQADRQILTPGQWQDLILAQEIVRSWRNGHSVYSACREFGSADVLLAGRASVLDAAKYYLNHHQAGPPPERMHLAAASERYYQNKVQTGKSKGHLKNLKSRLQRLGKALPQGLYVDEVDTASLETALLTLRLGPKTWNEYRGIMTNFFSWASRQNLVAKAHNPARELEQAKVKYQEIEFLRVAELKKILSLAPTARPDLVPFIVLVAFGALRPSECLRLDWSMVGSDHIRLPGVKSKTGFPRQIPIAANLRAWLAQWRKPSGPVCETNIDLSHVNRAIEQFSGVKLSHDSLRHGYGSHKQALTQNIAAVSAEMGNRLEICKRHYANPFVTTEEAQQWFAIMTVNASNVIPLPRDSSAQSDTAVNNA
jgi:integrase